MTVHSKLVDGLTNETISPATANLQREIRQILQAIQEGGGSGGSLAGVAPAYNILAGPYQVTVTTTSKKLSELGVVWKSGLRRVTLIPAGTNIYWANGGKAKSGVNLLPLAALEIDCSKAVIEKFEFVMSSSTQTISVIQEG